MMITDVKLQISILISYHLSLFNILQADIQFSKRTNFQIGRLSLIMHLPVMTYSGAAYP